MQSILITGGSGFLGSALVDKWLANGRQVSVLARHPQQVMARFGGRVRTFADFAVIPDDAQFDAVVNLAGEPLFAGRWSTARKQALRTSRIDLTERLLDRIANLTYKPACLISGSAIGIYGHQGDLVLSENSPFVRDFSQQLCADWEAAALRAEQLGIRVCLIRTGLVLECSGGLLQRLLLPYRLGLGGRLGDGKQWMAWIHRDDWLAIVDKMLRDTQMSGPYNATAPNPVTNQEFSRLLAATLQRPACLPLPAWLLKIGLGEMADLVLASQRVVPLRLLADGFVFQYPHLQTALQALLHRD